MTETLKGGYTFITAQCSVGGSNVATSINLATLTATFTGAADQPMACTFTNKRPPPATIATTPSAGGPVGTSISDTATVTNGLTPTGTVTFHLYAPGDTSCTGTAVFTSLNDPLSGAPLRATSGMFPSTAVGTYHWTATYNGDANNAPVSSLCADETVTTTKATPTISTVTVPSEGGPVGTPISDTATVSGGFAQTGTVTFNLFAPGNTTCTGTPEFTSTNPLSGSSATSGTFATIAAGIYHWEATYNGDANNVAATSGCAAEPVDITMGTPTTATVILNAAGNTPVAGPLPAGSSVLDTATVTGVTGVTPTGTVTYTFFTNGTCTAPGGPPATVTLNANGTVPNSGNHGPLAAGSYSFQAVYGGDANFTGSTSPCEPLTIAQTTPTIATTPSAGGPVGTSISDTATVSGGFTPTGTVTFDLFGAGDATCAGTPVFTATDRPLSGDSAASGTFATTAVGTFHWTATYNGDANNAPVTSLCADETVTTTKATPTISTTPSAGVPVGTTVSDTATVSGGLTPTGTVTFDLFAPGDATCAGTPVFTATDRPLSGDSASLGDVRDHGGGHLPLDRHLQR